VCFVFQDDDGAHRFPTLAGRGGRRPSHELMEVEGRDVGTVPFVEDDCVLALDFVEQGVRLLVRVHKVHWRFVGSTSIFQAWFLILVRCGRVFHSFDLSASINLLPVNVGHKLGLH
jgi:hypothetical protein